ncbi:HAD family hydrolase [Sporosarcina sp. G11-34]|uniref:HAD family hydrolase n=1 Tax=Sporosarcina sp. G11-34 TaxID=2849605 RepID=UPI0022A992BF|nr:HAD family hydrolase [Sporosarcina sp. G11-34]MCZ2260547.1 HAD family hydrolase [Sporosarcina sp. G11-34]
MVKAIFFDLDDTLLWDKKSVATAFRKTCERVTNTYDIDPSKLEEAVRFEASELYATYETFDYTKMIGINPFEGLWGTFDDEGESFQKMKELVPGYRRDAWTNGLKKMGIDDANLGSELAELFIEERKKSPFLYEETFSVLDRLKKDYQLVLITNGSPSLQQTKLEITPEIAPYFEHVIISGGFGVGKPNRTIFEHALALCNIEPGEALMVGDNLMTDILGASYVGIPSVWINRENNKAHEEIIPTYEIKDLNELFSIIENK